ncbi:hypothetical protein [Actinomadura sp. 7K507]|uniref:hypothetical protein n=1 Tax=Actinomadura sp. 7K507 TaxID=2530365 RepID=UPI0010451FFE|nr:hypothetical protein [Actinomadura sp. 7K507]TDC90216.1 hypothetical protein E1285_15090 [Actinomadura sp. 7K507]
MGALHWAVGGYPNLADGRPVTGLGDNGTGDIAPGTTAGVSANGRTFHLLWWTDGRTYPRA